MGRAPGSGRARRPRAVRAPVSCLRQRSPAEQHGSRGRSTPSHHATPRRARVTKGGGAVRVVVVVWHGTVAWAMGMCIWGAALAMSRTTPQRPTPRDGSGSGIRVHAQRGRACPPVFPLRGKCPSMWVTPRPTACTRQEAHAVSPRPRSSSLPGALCLCCQPSPAGPHRQTGSAPRAGPPAS